MVSLLSNNIKIGLKKYRITLLSLLTGIIAFSVLFILTAIFKTTLCPIRLLFNKKCFGCGMTRAFISILSFDYISALKYNVLSLPLFICISLYNIILLFDIIFAKNMIKRIEKQLSKKYMYIIYTIVLIVGAVINQC